MTNTFVSISRREFHRLAIAAGTTLALSRGAFAGNAKPLTFIHPGILHSAADLERMKKGVLVNQSPIAEGFKKLREHPLSDYQYAAHAFGNEIGRNPSVNFPGFDNDCNAAYQCSLMAAITGDKRFANAARTVILGWSRSLQTVSGADAVLMAGLGPFKLVNAAEILQAIGELDEDGAALFGAMLRRAIVPTIIDFAPFANGNWDTAAIKTMLAIAVFCEDRQLFDRALDYYLYGSGDGQLTHYIYENGQCQESGRDQQHTQLGLAHMGDACEIAWHQGLDLYSAAGNRLLLGFEYTARYNLGDDVEFRPDMDRTGKYAHKEISPRGPFRAVYEQVFAHYNGRQGLSTPALARVVAKIRPEGAAWGADHTGFGTLLYSRNEADVRESKISSPPAAVHASYQDGAIVLNWLNPRNARDYSIKRANEDARFRVLHSGISTNEFRDTTAALGRLYRYRVSVQGAENSTAPSPTTEILAGLPKGWREASLGNPPIAGNAQFDGKVLTLRASGTSLLDVADEGQFAYVEKTITALSTRFIPQIASSFVKFGLACRKGIEAKAPCLALLVMPDPGYAELHGWGIHFLKRDESGVVSTISKSPLNRPTVSYGRLMQPVWLRLEQNHTSTSAAFSLDGQEWTEVGRSSPIDGGLMGIVMSSGIPGVDTTARFDSLSALSDSPMTKG